MCSCFYFYMHWHWKCIRFIWTKWINRQWNGEKKVSLSQQWWSSTSTSFSFFFHSLACTTKQHELHKFTPTVSNWCVFVIVVQSHWERVHVNFRLIKRLNFVCRVDLMNSCISCKFCELIVGMRTSDRCKYFTLINHYHSIICSIKSIELESVRKIWMRLHAITGNSKCINSIFV